jgi:hypothetical protein
MTNTERPLPLCGGCHEPITGEHWYHHRLRVHIHDGNCMRNVKGEDVTNHCMTLIQPLDRQT